MPKRRGMSTSTILLLFAFIVLLIAVLVIFLAWNGITSAASNAIILWVINQHTLAFLILYFTVSSSSLMLIGIVLVALGALLVLINFIMNR